MLDADLATSLASVPDGPAKDQGVRVGKTAASADRRATKQRRLERVSDSVHAGNESGRLPADPARVRAAGLHPLAVRHAVRAPAREPVQARTAAGSDERDLHRGVQRGQEPRRDRQHHPHRRPDADRKFWGAPIQNYWNEIAQTRRAAARHHAAAERAPVRAARPHPRRLGDRLLRREVHVPLLAAGYRHPRRRRRGTGSAGRRRTSARTLPSRPPAHFSRWPRRPTGRRSPPRRSIRPTPAHTQSSVPRAPTCSPASSTTIATASPSPRRCCPGVDALVHELLGGRGRGQCQPHLRRPALPLRPGRRPAARPPHRGLRPPELPGSACPIAGAFCSPARPATSAAGCCGSSRSRGDRCAAWCADPRRCRDERLSKRRSCTETSSSPTLCTRPSRVSRPPTTSFIRWLRRDRSPMPTVAARRTSRPPRAGAA